MRARWEPALPGSAGSVEPPDISLAEIADRELLCERHVRLLAPLAFVAPRIVAAITDGNAPANLTVTGLAKALPYSWAEQQKGLPESATCILIASSWQVQIRRRN